MAKLTMLQRYHGIQDMLTSLYGIMEIWETMVTSKEDKTNMIRKVKYIKTLLKPFEPKTIL